MDGTGRKAPWGLLARDQAVVYALALVLVGAVGARYLVQWAEPKPVQRIEPGERICYRVNLNTADAAELGLLPGIGPKFAEKIIAWRKANAGFKSVKDLEKIKGIPSATVEKVSKMVTLDKPTSAGASPR